MHHHDKEVFEEYLQEADGFTARELLKAPPPNLSLSLARKFENR
jgi:hypothetical protein